jgi:uncharacterized protein YdbL (DUF1318 family)
MKTKIFAVLIFVTIVGGFLVNRGVFADDISAVKGRMEKRLSVLLELKSKGVVGEDRMGYLQFVSGSREKEDIINAENDDRKKVYASIAKKEGVDVAQVGQRRALQIADKARKGDWLQNQSGKWYQK